MRPPVLPFATLMRDRRLREVPRALPGEAAPSIPASPSLACFSSWRLRSTRLS